MALGLSDRDAAKRTGVSHVGIGKARKAGHIPLLKDGSIDPDGLTGWLENRRPPRGGNQVSTDPVTTPEVSTALPEKPCLPFGATRPLPSPPKPSADCDAAAMAASAMERTEAPGGTFAKRSDAELVKASFEAHLTQLKYERERGLLIETAKVAAAMEEDYGRVRTRLLAIPAEQSPRLHRCKTPMELQDALHSAVTEALEELSRGAADQIG